MAFASLLVGCLSAPGGSDGAQDGGDKKDTPIGVPSAYFTLQGTDLRSLDWPEAYSGYDLFICNPSLDANSVAQAKADRPDATFLGYTSVADAHIGLYSANPYWAALEAVFDSTLCVRDMWNDRIIRMGTADDPNYRIPYYVMGRESSDILVAFHRDVTLAAGFDGLYLDNCTQVVPPSRIAGIFDQALRVDVDRDGQQDNADRISAIYATWRPYYTAQLRAAVGDDRLLIANAGGPLGDSALNGITLEGVGHRFEVETARGYFAEQLAAATPPFLAVAWATTPESEQPCLDLVPQMEGLHYGHIAR
ncbi:hypothetical protein K8I85_00085 [bacterium]|nr:hypothetical protein [bacterium]